VADRQGIVSSELERISTHQWSLPTPETRTELIDLGPSVTSARDLTHSRINLSTRRGDPNEPRGSMASRRTPGKLPRPILPQNRTYIDRLMEYVVGDGPNNRYALVCRLCRSHNGMALKEEFEYF
ncbi:hypothetical protein QAD02_021617, partial [Eretmocerus hayati]